MNFKNLLPTYFCTENVICIGDPVLVCCKKQNQFIIYTTHFRSVNVPEAIFWQKAVLCSGALLKKQNVFHYIFFEKVITNNLTDSNSMQVPSDRKCLQKLDEK